MSGGANLVEQYAGADVPARIELLIKYYPNFIRLVEGYEQSLSFIIKEEKAYARKSVMGDLGVRVQTSGTGDPTAKAAIENVMIMEAIQKGNLESVTSELDEQVVMCYRECTIYLRSQFATSNTETENASSKGGRRYLPYAFTEQGNSNVVSSPKE